MIDFDSEERQSCSVLKRCIEYQYPNSESEKALRSPGVIVAIAKLRSASTDQDVLSLNLFRLGAIVALSIRDAESIR